MRVGDVRTAISLYEELCARDDATLTDQVNLALAQFRCGERDAALDTVLRVRAADHRHDPAVNLDAGKTETHAGR